MAPINPLYTPALMEHSSDPDYKYEMECATCTHEGVNPSCGDDLTLSLRINDKGVIEEAAWQGIGCAVSQASADMMSDLTTRRATCARSSSGWPAARRRTPRCSRSWATLPACRAWRGCPLA